MKNGLKKTGVVFTFAVLAGCASVRNALEPQAIDRQLTDKTYLYEVTRHLYRWYMDEADIEKSVRTKAFTFWVRERHPKLDDGDRSRFGEIVLPALNIIVSVKKPDYRVEEYGVCVTSAVYKIVNVARYKVPRSRPSEYTAVTTTYDEMKDYLFRTRYEATFPDENLVRRLRLSVRKAIAAEGLLLPKREGKGDPVIYLSPVSPVANELWVFWEGGDSLIRFASDVDIQNPALWEHDELAVQLYDVRKHVVVSLEEVAGSNAFMTRSQVGRVLFNCILLGRRMTLQPAERSDAATSE